MGMYDYVRCEFPLPDGWQPHDGLFQTKDLDCAMVTHLITKDGRLLQEQIDETHIVPKEQRTFPDAPDNSLKAMCGMLRTVTSRHDRNFHGVLNFYDYDHKTEAWHEYNAKFTDGQLVSIESVGDAN